MKNNTANTMNTIVMNAKGIANMMANIKGATICTIDTVTVPKMNKTGNPYFGKVVKVARVQMQFGYDYENAVNNRLKAMGLEPNFDAMGRKWGVWVVPNKVAEHKGELYLRFYTMENPNSISEVYYAINEGGKYRVANPSEVAEIKSFMPNKGESNRQSEAGLTEHQVEPREFKISSIRKIAVNGVVYERAEENEEVVEIVGA